MQLKNWLRCSIVADSLPSHNDNAVRIELDISPLFSNLCYRAYFPNWQTQQCGGLAGTAQLRVLVGVQAEHPTHSSPLRCHLSKVGIEPCRWVTLENFYSSSRLSKLVLAGAFEYIELKFFINIICKEFFFFLNIGKVFALNRL